MTADRTEMKVACSRCGNEERNHRILFEEHVILDQEDNGFPLELECHLLVQCMGCESIKYVRTLEDNYVILRNGRNISKVEVFPDSPDYSSTRKINSKIMAGKLPHQILKIYIETVKAIQSRILTLAAGGLRAIVEAICIDKNVQGSNLYTKINDLVQRNFLTSPQADLLHEQRYLGNAALHQLETPTFTMISDALDIVETLIIAIYILPTIAQRLKDARES